MANLDKMVDELSVLSIAESVELVKMLEEKWGVSAAAPVAVAGGGAVAAAEEKTEFSVELVDGGATKLAVIKELRVIVPSLGLKEAKDLVDTAPKMIKESCSKDEAEEIKKKLEAAGAKVVVK